MDEINTLGERGAVRWKEKLFFFYLSTHPGIERENKPVFGIVVITVESTVTVDVFVRVV